MRMPGILALMVGIVESISTIERPELKEMIKCIK